MKLHHFNLCGVILLTGLCICQWARNRELNLALIRLQRISQEQSLQLLESTNAFGGLSADLNDSKAKVAQSNTELIDVRRKLSTAEHELHAVASERDKLRTSLTNWTSAVAVRDDRLSQSEGQTKRLSEELQTAVAKFNGLASNYNNVVKELNELRVKHAKLKE